MKLARAVLPLLFAVIAACAVLLLLQPGLLWAVVATQTQTTIEEFNLGAFYRTGMTHDDDGEVTLLRQGVAGAWITTTNATGLVPRYAHAAAIYNNRYYVFGGRGGQNSLRSIQYAQINSTTHNFGNWSTASVDLPTSIYTYTNGGYAGVAYLSAVLVNGRVYLLGGENGNQDFRYDTVVYATLNPTSGDLGNWTTTTSLPAPRSEGQAVVVNGWIYYIGGRTGSNNIGTDTVYYAKPDPTTGAITSWSTTTAHLPYKPYAHMAVAANDGRLYVLSGVDESTLSGGVVPEVYYAQPDANTGNITAWTETINLPRSIAGGAGVYFGGQFYLTGGWLDIDSNAPSDLVFSAFEEDTGGVITWTSASAIDPARALHTALASSDGWLYLVGGAAGQFPPIQEGIINVGATTGGGGSAYARSGLYRSADFDLVKKYQILGLNWTTGLADPSVMSLTLRYRYRDTLGGAYSSWVGPFPSNAVAGIATTTIELSQTARFLQYEAAFSTTNTALSPILYQVTVSYDRPVPPEFSKESNPVPGPGLHANDRITYTLKFKNTTGGVQSNVSLADVIPAGTTYVAGSVFATAGITPFLGLLPNQLIWLVGDVPINGEGQVGFVVTVNQGLVDGTAIENKGNYDSNTSNLDSNRTTHFLGQPLRVFKTHQTTTGADQVQPGDIIQYTLIYSNPSDSATVTNAVLTDNLPPELEFVSGSPTPAVNGQTLSWSLPSISANTSGQVNFTARVTTQAVDQSRIENTADLAAPLRQTVTSAPDLVDVLYRYDVKLGQSVDQLHAVPGSTLTYTFNLTNVTAVSVTVQNIQLSVYLAPGLPGMTRTHVLDCAAPCAGWNFGGTDTEGDLIYTRTIASLAPGETAQFALQAIISPTLPADVLAVEAISEALDDGAHGIEIDPTNNLGDSITTIDAPLYDLQLAQSVDLLKAPPGSTLNYTFQVTNVTTVALSLKNVLLSVDLQPGLPGLTRTAVLNCAAPCAGWNFGGLDVSGNLLYTRTLASLAPGETAQFALQAIVSPTLPADVLAVAVTSEALPGGALGVDIDPANNLDKSITTVSGADIEVQQITAPATAVSGKTFKVDVTLTNNGFAPTRGPDGAGWFGVDLYVKPSGSPPPSGPSDRYLGACPTAVNPCPTTIRYAQYQAVKYPNGALAIDEAITLTYQISVPVDGTYWLYAQADPYWNVPAESVWGSPEHGRIVEGDEVNNISGPVVVVGKKPMIFLPIVRR